MAARGRRLSTRKIYNSRLLHFTRWCDDHDISPTEAPVSSVADLFMYLFHSGLQIATIRNYRSALAAIHSGFNDGSTVSDNAAIHHLLRGMFVERPHIKRLLLSWDLGNVLRILAGPPFEPLSDASDLHLSVKLAFLLAVVTSRRGSELHALSTAKGHIRWEPHGVRLIPAIEFLTKNQTPTFRPPDIFVPDIASFSGDDSDKKWCPVRTLKRYLARTKRRRDPGSRLFITTTKPFHHYCPMDSLSHHLGKTRLADTSRRDDPISHQSTRCSGCLRVLVILQRSFSSGYL